MFEVLLNFIIIVDKFTDEIIFLIIYQFTNLLADPNKKVFEGKQTKYQSNVQNFYT